MSKPTPLLAALALAAVLIPAAAVRAGQTQLGQSQPSQSRASSVQASSIQAHLSHAPASTPPASVARPAASPVRQLLSVQGAGVVAVPPGATETSALMTLRNAGARPIVLTGVQTALAEHAMLMTTRRDAQGRSGMSAVKTLTVPARGALHLRPSGDHLMLMGLKRTLRVGEKVRLTLRVRGGPPLVVDAVVRRP